MLNYFKDVQSNYKTWDLEIATNGWNFEDFSTFTAAQQLDMLTNATTRIKSLLGLTGINTFVPPYNNFNTYTMNGLTSLGYTHISSSTVADPAPYYLSGKTFYHYPTAAATSDTSVVSYYAGVPAATTLAQIQTQINNFGFSVVMVRAMEFGSLSNGVNTDVLNSTQYNELLTLFTSIKAANIGITTINKINTSPIAATTGTPATTAPVSTTGTPASTTGAPVTSTTGTPAPTTPVSTTGTPAPTTPASTTGTPAPTTPASTTGTPAPTTPASTTGETPATSTPASTTGTPATTGCPTPTNDRANATTTTGNVIDDLANDAHYVVANIAIVVAAVTALLA